MRNKIGFFYINDPNWTGGQDYVINAVNSLSFLNEKDQPQIDIIVDESIDLEDLKKKINYRKYEFFVLQNTSSAIKRKIQHFRQMIRWKYVYPFPKGSIYESKLKGVSNHRKIYWIPDFQEEYFPELFEKGVIEKRRKTRNWLAKQSHSTVVFSSENAKEDFYKYYGPKIAPKVKVLRFANPHKWEFNEAEKSKVLDKYGLKSDHFFICPNQFWKHKNHGLLINAVRAFHIKGVKVCVVLCGKENDPRFPDYFPELRSAAEDLVQVGALRFLGFLPKHDQMCLIKESKALIQPSLFEGWSTTIEDAISLGKKVIAANLEVNIEQLGSLGVYFNPREVSDLINVLETENQKNGQDIDYRQKDRLQEFAKNLIQLER
jgi:glycosyltransferase involved in cell wall biosynthesis